MKKYIVFVVFPILFAAVAPFNIQTTIFDGTANSISELTEPFTKIGDNYYLIEPNNQTTWHGAVHFCRTKGAHLTSIESFEEWQALNSYLVSKGYDNWFWIGANAIDTAFKFFWISTGQPVNFTKWNHGQPDNHGDWERCVHLIRIGDEFLMQDWWGYHQAYYICKADKPKTVSITIW